jgi:hypothetical protein
MSSCKCWQNCTVAGEAVQNSQYCILFTLQSQGDMFNDTHTILSRSVLLPESNVGFTPSKAILKCEQTSAIHDLHSRRLEPHCMLNRRTGGTAFMSMFEFKQNTACISGIHAIPYTRYT